MAKIYSIDDLIFKSDETLKSKMQKLNITDEQMDILYAITSAECSFRFESHSMTHNCIRSVKIKALQNILSLWQLENIDFCDLEDVLISKNHNTLYKEAKSFLGAKYIYTQVDIIDTDFYYDILTVIFAIVIDKCNEFVCAYKFNDDLAYFGMKQKELKDLEEYYPDFIDKVKEICEVRHYKQ